MSTCCWCPEWRVSAKRWSGEDEGYLELDEDFVAAAATCLDALELGARVQRRGDIPGTHGGAPRSECAYGEP